MVEAGGRTAETFGVSRLLGQIYTLLYLKNEALSLDQIVLELDVSKASVSIACRQLHTFGAVRRITQKGDRRDFYEAIQDFRGLLQNGLLPAVEKKLDSARVQIDRCRSLLIESDSQEALRLKHRLDEAEERRAKISDLIKNPLLRRML
jgi:HTH-type transcriptional regulator, glycine betaine synthesis regulator